MYDYQQRMSRPTGPDYVDTSGAQGFFEDGWLMFSGLMIFFVGFWNAFEGGLAFLRSAYFAGTPSVHFGAWQIPPTQVLFVQSLLATHFFPSAHLRAIVAQLPPQSTSVSLPF